MLPLLLIGCELDQGLYVYTTEAVPGDTATPMDIAPEEDVVDDSDADSGEGGGGQDPGPRPPRTGELVISELMINPSGSADEDGIRFVTANAFR